MRYWYSLAVVDGMAILYGGYGHPQRLSDLFALRFGWSWFYSFMHLDCWTDTVSVEQI